MCGGSSSASSDASFTTSASAREHERNRPALPYRDGHEITVKRHFPNEPFGLDYPNDAPPKPPCMYEMTQLEYCLYQQPFAGSTDGELTRELTITKELVIEDGRGAQVVVVNKNLVAKIFDPLYYPFCDAWGDIEDCVRMADQDYLNEANAYQDMHDTRLEGECVPVYHGSWTFDVKHNDKTRSVRLVLLDYVKGRCMEDIYPDELSDDARENIMASVIEAETQILFTADVVHGDIAPRNVIVCGRSSQYDSPELRVCLIDFNRACVGRVKYGNDHKCVVQYAPMMRWWGMFREFVKTGWFETSHEATDWMWEHFGDSEKYLKVHRDPKYRYGPPLEYWLPFAQDEEVEPNRCEMSAGRVHMQDEDSGNEPGKHEPEGEVGVSVEKSSMSDTKEDMKHSDHDASEIEPKDEPGKEKVDQKGPKSGHAEADKAAGSSDNVIQESNNSNDDTVTKSRINISSDSKSPAVGVQENDSPRLNDSSIELQKSARFSAKNVTIDPQEDIITNAKSRDMPTFNRPIIPIPQQSTQETVSSAIKTSTVPQKRSYDASEAEHE